MGFALSILNHWTLLDPFFWQENGIRLGEQKKVSPIVMLLISEIIYTKKKRKKTGKKQKRYVWVFFVK